MPVNFLAVCVGNTRTRIGVFVEDSLVESPAVLNRSHQVLGDKIRDAFRQISARSSPRVLLASTCPPVTEHVDDVVSRMGAEALRVEKDIAVPIGRQIDPEAIVGEDRLLNAAAAYDTLRQACVVVDAGSAITIDFVDGSGTFHGGAIAPGAKAMLDALGHCAWQLPEIDRLEEPDEVIGRNTVQAMRSGVFHGLRGMVRELTEHYAEIAGVYPTVVATGGDAELLFSGYDLVEHVVPDLTLIGMKLTLTGPAETRGESGS